MPPAISINSSPCLRSRLTVWQAPTLIAAAGQYSRLPGLNSHALSRITWHHYLAGHRWREVRSRILGSRPHYFFSQHKFGARPFLKSSTRRGATEAVRHHQEGEGNYSLHIDQLASHGGARNELRRRHCFAASSRS